MILLLNQLLPLPSGYASKYTPSPGAGAPILAIPLLEWGQKMKSHHEFPPGRGNPYSD